MDQIRVGLIGSAFCSNIHAEAFEEVANAQVTAKTDVGPIDVWLKANN